MKKNHWISLGVISEAKSAMQIRGEMSTLKLISNVILREGSQLREKIAFKAKKQIINTQINSPEEKGERLITGLQQKENSLVFI